MPVSGKERARRALPRLLILYAAASLLHFVHDAEYLAQYPNLPSSWSRADIYVAWCCISTLGVAGYLFYLHGNRAVGLTFLASYAVLGFGGLLHYTRVTNIAIVAARGAGPKRNE